MFSQVSCFPTPEAFSVTDWIQGDDGNPASSGVEHTLSINEIYEMRVRDIKRRLTRQHGYGADEVARMIDKKELINALSYEEHKTLQKEQERKKRVMFRRSFIVALICVIVVIFKPLFVHVWEVACVNFVVYTGKSIHSYIINETISKTNKVEAKDFKINLFL